MIEVPNCFYRVSIKALILDDTRTKFLVIQETSGHWDLPGGGLDWKATPQEDLPREIDEEMGVEVTRIAEHPCYFLTFEKEPGYWIANVLYETKLASLNFTPSDECTATRFVTPDEVPELDARAANVDALASMFDANHWQ